MRVIVVGAGAAGLTAAYRLQQRGHDVVVLERESVVGGRTHSEHFGSGHWADTGAGWLASFYPQTLALLEEIGQRDRLQRMVLRGGGDLLLNGRVVPFPSSARRIATSDLLSPGEKARFFAYLARVFARQGGNLDVDLAHDRRAALDELAPLGAGPRERIVRPLFEGPFFSRLEEMSATLLRSWLRVLSVGTFFHVDGGMDAPWRHIGEIVGARTGVTVTSVSDRPGGGVEVVSDAGTDAADACVVALPAPVAVTLVRTAPRWMREVQYAPHVRLYASRRAAGPPRRGIHVFPNDLVATVEVGAGRFGAWGAVPPDRTWGLVCAPAATSGKLLAMEPAEAIDALWSTASTIDPELFRLDSADVVHLIRWRHAVPIVGPGYYTRLGALQQRPPIVYAGDWLVQPCVEGAVRSGEHAAALLTG